jgi:pimeloyl-ACP methyl ester carboxylesterase
VLLHGLFGFRAQTFGPIKIEYFRGIAEALSRQGHIVKTTGVNPVGSVAQRAKQLQQELHEIVDLLPAGEKVLLVAHSMGGLDARRVLSDPATRIAPHVSALITIATPHCGSPIADLTVKINEPVHVPALLRPFNGAHAAISQVIKTQLSENAFYVPEWIQWLGMDHDAIQDLTTDSCAIFNRVTPNHHDIRYFWVATNCTGSVPFFFQTTFEIINNDTGPSGGPNDGVVAIKSSEPPVDIANPWTPLGTWPVDHLNAVNMRMPGDPGRPDVAEWYVDLLNQVTKDHL